MSDLGDGGRGVRREENEIRKRRKDKKVRAEVEMGDNKRQNRGNLGR